MCDCVVQRGVHAFMLQEKGGTCSSKVHTRQGTAGKGGEFAQLNHFCTWSVCTCYVCASSIDQHFGLTFWISLSLSRIHTDKSDHVDDVSDSNLLFLEIACKHTQ